MCDEKTKRLERRTKPLRDKASKLLTEGRLIDVNSGPQIVTTELYRGRIVVKYTPVCSPHDHDKCAQCETNLTTPPAAE